MTMVRTASAVSTVLFSWSVLCGTPASAAQDALARAKDLYMSAAYEDALVALSDYRPAPTERVEADEYRAFCLLALGKLDDATKVIEQIVTANPTFQPPEAQASPRIQDAFRSVRRRLLPAIVRQIYTDAKSAYDRADYDVASKQFERVTTLLADADVAASGDLADLRVLSKGFGDLIQKQQTAAAAAQPPAPSQPPPPQAAPKPSAEIDRVYSAEDVDVIAPVAISQTVPPWRPTGPQPAAPREVTLMVLIDETGRVASVRVAGTLLPPYDAQLRQAASRWRYQPATRNGRPVKYRKAVAIRLQPNGE
jgi:tetratricopeptide (TPR) repeat protein